ncbi:hypothetical protein Cph01nite_05550 [Cellulomonas phragmiteti]|uniref:Polysaccharide biosynthesis protein n=1 Tax=Cellulomonas phragmiteti TaxID=478780 RepID=A0ABQ4DHG5_9CELL|nr:hypothetical protein Cph01nite_05550 [Cellulomonas phragmiteti]
MLMLSALPFLTRLLAPGVLGNYLVANAFALMLQPVASLRVEFLIPIAGSPSAVDALVRRGRLASLGTGVVVALAGWICTWAGADAVGHIALLTAPLSSLYGLFAIENAVLIRRRALGRLAARNALGGALTAVLQVAFAFVSATALAVVAAAVLGRGAAVLVTGMRSGGHDRAPGTSAPEGLAQYGGRRAFEVISVGLLSTATLQVLTVMMAFLFGPVSAGHVGASVRLAGAPMGLLGQGLSQVVQAGVSPILASGEPRLKLAVRRLALRLSFGALVAAPVVGVGGGLLAPRLLGPGWEQSGAIIALLAAPFAGQLVVAPLNPVLVMIGRERILLVVQGARLVMSVIATAAAAALTGSVLYAVASFGVATMIAYVLTIWIILRETKRYDAAIEGTDDSSP